MKFQKSAKLFITALLMAAMMLSLAACGDSGTPSNGGTTNPQTSQGGDTQPSVEIVIPEEPEEVDPAFFSVEVEKYQSYTRQNWEAESWDAKEVYAQLVGNTIIFSGNGVTSKLYFIADMFSDNSLRITQFNNGPGVPVGTYYGYYVVGKDPDPEFAEDYSALYITYINDLLEGNQNGFDTPAKTERVIATEINTNVGIGYTTTMALTGDFSAYGQVKNYDVTMATEDGGILDEDGKSKWMQDDFNATNPDYDPSSMGGTDAAESYFFTGVETVTDGSKRALELTLYDDGTLKLERIHPDYDFVMNTYTGTWSQSGGAFTVSIEDSGTTTDYTVSENGGVYSFTWNRIDPDNPGTTIPIELSTAN